MAHLYISCQVDILHVVATADLEQSQQARTAAEARAARLQQQLDSESKRADHLQQEVLMLKQQLAAEQQPLQNP